MLHPILKWLPLPLIEHIALRNCEVFKFPGTKKTYVQPFEGVLIEVTATAKNTTYTPRFT